jgi:hypothetical protein
VDAVAFAHVPQVRFSRQAADALALPLSTLAEACPWGMDEILDSDFFPAQK